MRVSSIERKGVNVRVLLHSGIVSSFKECQDNLTRVHMYLGLNSIHIRRSALHVRPEALEGLSPLRTVEGLSDTDGAN